MWFTFVTAPLFIFLRFQTRLTATLWRAISVVNSPLRRAGLAPACRPASLAQAPLFPVELEVARRHRISPPVPGYLARCRRTKGHCPRALGCGVSRCSRATCIADGTSRAQAPPALPFRPGFASAAADGTSAFTREPLHSLCVVPPHTHRRFKFEHKVCVGRDMGATTER